ncbi:MAG: ADOP family duplicated permease [Vicinamibacteraceae bacterium]
MRRRAVERELNEELQFHLQQLAERYADTGCDARSAAHEASRRFGGLDQVKEGCREMRTMHPFEDFLRDVRFGLRLLVRSPVFSIVAVLSLAIGIGFNGAIFTLVNAIILRSLPVPNPDQLMVVEVQQPPFDPTQRFGYPTFLEARDALAGEVTLAAATGIHRGLLATPGPGHSGEPMQGRYQLVSGEYFELLRQTPQIGRLLGQQDNLQLGGHPVAVISDAFWSGRFARSPTAIGTSVVLNGTALTIVGVTAPKFFGTTLDDHAPDVWAPVMMQAVVHHSGNASFGPGDGEKPWPPQRNIAWLNLFARVTAAGQAARVAHALQIGRLADLAERQGEEPDPGQERFVRQTRVTLEPAGRGLSSMREEARAPLLVLLIMVGLLLLIAGANIASLLIARSSSRAREMAIRLSIGAGRLRLVRQLLAESLLLALAGGALGLILASQAGRLLLTLAGSTTDRLDLDLGLNWSVVGFTFAVSMLAGLLFGLLPALRSTRVSLSDTLRAQARGVGEAVRNRGRLPMGKVLVAAQMAFSLLLLLVAGLFARTLYHLAQVDLGMETDQIVAARVELRQGGYQLEQLPALYRRIIDRASAIPGVTSASMSSRSPLHGGYESSSFGPEGYQRAKDEVMDVRTEIVSLMNLQTLGVPLVEGRYFSEADFASKRRVSIINETTAKKYFKGSSALGKRWCFDADFTPDEAFEVIGVAKDARYYDLRAPIPNMVYLPTSLQEDAYLGSIEVRSTRPTAAVKNDLRAALREIEPKLPIIDMMSISERANHSMNAERFVAYLMAIFGGVALLLACLGLYGTISYAVSRRTSELGVRIALGAKPASVLWLVLREALLLVAIGLLVGIPLTFVAARGLSSLLYGVQPTDPVAATSAALVLVLVAAVAAYLPARRISCRSHSGLAPRIRGAA